MTERQKIEKFMKIDVYVNATYVVVDGQVIQLDNPKSGYGKQEISWQKGKVVHVAYKYNQTI